MALGGKLGVNLFVLITGYFMVESKIRVRKLVILWAPILLYSVAGTLLFYKINGFKLDVMQLREACFPIIYSKYWFATVYFLLYLFIPFLNILIQNINPMQHFGLITFMFTIWSLIPTMIGEELQYSQLGLFVFLYLTAAYIRKYPNKYFESARLGMVAGIALYLTIIGSVIVLDRYGLANEFPGKDATYFSRENLLPLVLCSIALFCGFKNLKMKYNRIINYIAGSMFGIYLIHDNLFIRYYLWIQLFKNKEFSESPNLWLHAVMAVTCVFIGGLFIDIIRRETLEKLLQRFMNRFFNSKLGRKMRETFLSCFYNGIT